RPRTQPTGLRNGQTPTCTSPIRAIAPRRAVADSIRARTACSSTDLSNTAARLTTSAVAIAPPSHHRRPRVRNITIDSRMPQPDRAPAGGRQAADGGDHVRFNRALWAANGERSLRSRFCPHERGIEHLDERRTIVGVRLTFIELNELLDLGL